MKPSKHIEKEALEYFLILTGSADETYVVETEAEAKEICAMSDGVPLSYVKVREVRPAEYTSPRLVREIERVKEERESLRAALAVAREALEQTLSIYGYIRHNWKPDSIMAAMNPIATTLMTGIDNCEKQATEALEEIERILK